MNVHPLKVTSQRREADYQRRWERTAPRHGPRFAAVRLRPRQSARVNCLKPARGLGGVKRGGTSPESRYATRHRYDSLRHGVARIAHVVDVDAPIASADEDYIPGNNN